MKRREIIINSGNSESDRKSKIEETSTTTITISKNPSVVNNERELEKSRNLPNPTKCTHVTTAEMAGVDVSTSDKRSGPGVRNTDTTEPLGISKRKRERETSCDHDEAPNIKIRHRDGTKHVRRVPIRSSAVRKINTKDPHGTSAVDPSTTRRKSGDEVPKEKTSAKNRTEAATPAPVFIDKDRLANEIGILESAMVLNTNRADFEEKYWQLSKIGKGGFGSVYKGQRKLDALPVAIKHIAVKYVKSFEVVWQGKTYRVIGEIYLMLRAASELHSADRSAAVFLLDWYNLEEELILVMERPRNSTDLNKYIVYHGKSLTENLSKLIMKQLVDAVVYLHSKKIFHRDIKLSNVLIQNLNGQPKVYIIDFGCSCLAANTPYFKLCGTIKYFPPEWFDSQKYRARSTTVWQLGALFYSLLHGHMSFSTKDFIENTITIRSTLSTDLKSLLEMCLVRNPKKRATLMELQQHPVLRDLRPTPALPASHQNAPSGDVVTQTLENQLRVASSSLSPDIRCLPIEKQLQLPH